MIADDGEWVFSPSQVSSYEACPRLWAWDKIDRLPRKGSRYTVFGTDADKMLEDWLIRRIPPPFQAGDEHTRRVAATVGAMIPLLPPPQTVGLQAQVGFTVEIPRALAGLGLGSYKLRGFKDLVLAPRHIWDHKTTSDLVWAKKAEDIPEVLMPPDEPGNYLVGDPQATTYALDAMVQHDVESAVLQWTYGTREKRPRALPVVREVTYVDIEPRLAQTVRSCEEMNEIRLSGKRALELPYNGASCDRFGGCPYQENCNLSSQERLESIMSSFAEKLAQKRAAQGAPTPHPPAVGQPAPAPAALAPAPVAPVQSAVLAPVTTTAPPITAPALAGALDSTPAPTAPEKPRSVPAPKKPPAAATTAREATFGAAPSGGASDLAERLHAAAFGGQPCTIGQDEARALLAEIGLAALRSR